MCRFAIVLTCLLGLTLTVVAQPAIGTAAPNFTLNNVNGSGPVSLSSFLGEVVLLNFFGATCGDCIEDAPLTEAIYQMYQTNPDFNIIGIDVWNLPAVYVNGTFRAQTGVTYTLLANGRTTGYAYNMEVNPVPSATDNEHCGYVIVDREGIMRHYWIYHPFDVTQQQEIICALNRMLAIPPSVPQRVVILTNDDGDPFKLCWDPVPCATNYLVFRSLAGDWSDETLVESTTLYVYSIAEVPFGLTMYRVVAVNAAP